MRGQQPAAVLEPALRGVTCRPAITTAGSDWTLSVPPERELAVRGRAGLGRAGQAGSPGRLRPCANDECRLFLIDRSKPNSARWCSMAACGNRMKARRHYQRARGTAPG